MDVASHVRILEFGAGEGTRHLARLLRAKGLTFTYTTFEHEAAFADVPEGVDLRLYSISPEYRRLTNDDEGVYADIDAADLSGIDPVDLVIIDGPHGVARARWYSRIRPLVRVGTILLIDDFDHYARFAEELDRNYEYETIRLYDREHDAKSFKIVRVTGLKPLA